MDGSTKAIIWVAGVIVIVCGSVFLLGENEKRQEKIKAQCESKNGAWLERNAYGRYSKQYKKYIKDCMRSPNTHF
ncbi:hypothetical protein [Prochlorococcus marinus]|uniref:hypothetical protein n=1 Tax=Prochlorococcus marinus TaxID=1219 RepID=UPI0022B3FE19|nr:hypothetical protein [Prochlorococcus marinus]